MRSVRLLVMAALLAATLGDAWGAGGSPVERAHARELFRAAQQHYKLAEYTQALDGFKEAYRLVEDPSLLFNLAQCYRQLNKKEDAIHFYRTYLHDAADVSNRASVEQIVASLEKAVRDEQAARAAPPQSTIEQAPPRPGEPTVTTVVTPTPAPAPAPTDGAELTATSTAPPAKTPIYKKWWLWTAVAGVVVVGVGVGLGVALSRAPGAPAASTQDGTFHPF